MKNYDSAFLGYDIRIDPELVPREWSRERRLTYLLNPEIDIPLSVDTLCWPSASEHRRRADSTSGVKSDPAKEPVVAKKVFSKEPLFNNGFWVDALTVVQIEEPDWSSWKLLGFDVADEGRISGLCNCGYKASEVEQLRAWKDKLNAHGLFSALDDAIAFVDVTNERVKEHAPFYVYGLFTHV